MGLCIFNRSCDVYPENSTVDATQPDPLNFKVLTIQQIGKNVCAVIEYPNATNFEGQKICLFLNTTIKEIMDLKEIDPHFSEERLSPFARFKPTDKGWDTAIFLADRIDRGII